MMIEQGTCTAEVELRGHILDSLIFSDVLDEILSRGGDYEIRRLEVGHAPASPSYARLRIRASSSEQLEEILTRLRELGADRLED